MEEPVRVLVVGCGFIGARLTGALVAAGHPTSVLARTPPRTARRLLAGATVLEGDARDAGLVERAIRNADHVVYAAGSLFPGAATLETAHAAEELPPLLAVLDGLRRNPETMLTFISSGGAVYGIPQTLPVPESHPTNPINSYGIVKLAGERHVLAYSHHDGFPARVLRVSNVYGEGQPSDRGQGVVATFLEGARTGAPVPLYGDGSVVRDFIHVDDLAAVIVRLLSTPGAPAVLNVGSGVGVSLRSLSELVEEITGELINLTPHPARPVDVPEIVLDVSRLRRWVDRPSIDLADGIELTWRATRGSLQAAG